jgi:hypothetical protein
MGSGWRCRQAHEIIVERHVAQCVSFWHHSISPTLQTIINDDAAREPQVRPSRRSRQRSSVSRLSIDIRITAYASGDRGAAVEQSVVAALQVWWVEEAWATENVNSKGGPNNSQREWNYLYTWWSNTILDICPRTCAFTVNHDRLGHETHAEVWNLHKWTCENKWDDDIKNQWTESLRIPFCTNNKIYIKYLSSWSGLQQITSQS